MSEPLSIGMCAQTACVLDVSTYKPGNVNLFERFLDMTAVDFLLSAAAIAPILDQASLRPIGATILECVRATRRVTTVNTNLGIVLLLAPLASVQPHLDLRGGVMRALMRLGVEDARAAYEAFQRHGALFPVQLGTLLQMPLSQVDDVLGELAAAGLVTSDGYPALRH